MFKICDILLDAVSRPTRREGYVISSTKTASKISFDLQHFKNSSAKVLSKVTRLEASYKEANNLIEKSSIVDKLNAFVHEANSLYTQANLKLGKNPNSHNLMNIMKNMLTSVEKKKAKVAEKMSEDVLSKLPSSLTLKNPLFKFVAVSLKNQAAESGVKLANEGSDYQLIEKGTKQGGKYSIYLKLSNIPTSTQATAEGYLVFSSYMTPTKNKYRDLFVTYVPKKVRPASLPKSYLLSNEKEVLTVLSSIFAKNNLNFFQIPINEKKFEIRLKSLSSKGILEVMKPTYKYVLKGNAVLIAIPVKDVGKSKPTEIKKVNGKDVIVKHYTYVKNMHDDWFAGLYIDIKRILGIPMPNKVLDKKSEYRKTLGRLRVTAIKTKDGMVYFKFVTIPIAIDLHKTDMTIEEEKIKMLKDAKNKRLAQKDESMDYYDLTDDEGNPVLFPKEDENYTKKPRAGIDPSLVNNQVYKDLSRYRE